MKIKTTPPRSGQKGFTLIEIVMVLVLLGILAAVAMPKYFDLKEEAEKRAAEAVIQEAQARLNGLFAEAVLSGTTCAAFVDNGNDIATGIVVEMRNEGLNIVGMGGATDHEYFTVAVAPDAEWKTYHEGNVYFPRCQN